MNFLIFSFSMSFHFCFRLPKLFVAYFTFIFNVLSQFYFANIYCQQFAVPAFSPLRPLLYANTLWPFPLPSAYSDPTNANQYQQNSAAVYGPMPQQQQPPPFYQQPPPPFAVWPPPQPKRRPQPVQLNDLIAQLSISIVRSLAQLLTEREMGAQGIGAVSKDTNRQKPEADRGDFDSPRGEGATERVQPRLTSAESRNGHRQFELAQAPAAHSLLLASPRLASVGGVSNTKYGYGLKAGLFVGHYGTSESIVSPLGPYGPINSQIGGSYGGLSQWPIVLGRPQTPKSANAADESQSTQSLPMTTIRQQQNSDANTYSTPTQIMGEGTVVQIPIGENVQGVSEAQQQMPSFGREGEAEENSR